MHPQTIDSCSSWLLQPVEIPEQEDLAAFKRSCIQFRNRMILGSSFPRTPGSRLRFAGFGNLGGSCESPAQTFSDRHWRLGALRQKPDTQQCAVLDDSFPRKLFSLSNVGTPYFGA